MDKEHRNNNSINNEYPCKRPLTGNEKDKELVIFFKNQERNSQNFNSTMSRFKQQIRENSKSIARSYFGCRS